MCTMTVEQLLGKFNTMESIMARKCVMVEKCVILFVFGNEMQVILVCQEIGILKFETWQLERLV